MGLKPEYHGELNGIWLKPIEHRRRRFAEMREAYKEDSVALQQIDVYDGESQYYPHIRTYRDALTNGDKETVSREEAWFREHYPDIK